MPGRQQKQPFTAEIQTSNGYASNPAHHFSTGNPDDFRDILGAIQALRNEIGALKKADPGQDDFARDVRHEIAQMVKTIAQAKSEIASIKHPMAEDDRVKRASSELDAIVLATEAATNTILEAVETIEQKNRELFQSFADDDQMTALTDQIGNQIVLIMEACNFQDLTGQRISKVINTLRFIEERIVAMIEIWGPESFKELPEPELVDSRDQERLTNGPALEGEGISQDDIDALFD